MMIAAEQQSLIIPAIPDLIWGTVSFFIIAAIVYKVAWPTFIKTLDERTEKIDSGLNAAARAREEIEAERLALSEQVDEARREAARIREQAQNNAADIVTAAQKRAESEARRIHEASERQIAADTQSAQKSLQSGLGAVASTLAARIVGEQLLDPAVSSGVIDRFLDELEAENAGAKEN